VRAGESQASTGKKTNFNKILLRLRLSNAASERASEYGYGNGYEYGYLADTQIHVRTHCASCSTSSEFRWRWWGWRCDGEDDEVRFSSVRFRSPSVI